MEDRITTTSAVRRFQKRIEDFQSTQDGKMQKMINNEDVELNTNGWIIKTNDGFELSIEKKENIVAEAIYIKQIKEKGWDKLTLNTYSNANSFAQSYMAGYLEGRITATEIDAYFKTKNKHNNFNSDGYKIIFDFFKTVNENLFKKLNNLEHNKSQTNDEKQLLKMSQILLGYAQLTGLHEGYTYESKKRNLSTIELKHFLVMQADGELPELQRAINYLKSANKKKLGEKDYFKEEFGIEATDPKEFWKSLLKTSKCSAFVKLVQDSNGKNTNLLFGHTTWGEKIELLRIYKYHNFEFDKTGEFSSSKIMFPGYPATLSSTDDFYVTNHKLAITETTLEVIDLSVYQGIKTAEEYLPNFMRVLGATRFSKSVGEWIDHFTTFNSGTYSSQWIVVDYKKFESIVNTKNKTDSLIIMLEQQPKGFVHKDISENFFKYKFIGGYNRIYFDETYDNMNQKLVDKVYGKFLGSSSESNRGKQFKALYKNVVDIKTMIQILRYNGYKLNLFPGDSSNNDASTSISSRYDVKSPNTNFIGGIDTKVTDLEMINKLGAVAINGPTEHKLNNNLKDYEFPSEETANNLGLPKQISFPYLYLDPNTIDKKGDEDRYKIEFEENANSKLIGEDTEKQPDIPEKTDVSPKKKKKKSRKNMKKKRKALF